MPGLTVVVLWLLLLTLGIMATHPMGAVQRCRESIERARGVTVEVRK